MSGWFPPYVYYTPKSVSMLFSAPAVLINPVHSNNTAEEKGTRPAPPGHTSRLLPPLQRCKNKARRLLPLPPSHMQCKQTPPTTPQEHVQSQTPLLMAAKQAQLKVSHPRHTQAHALTALVRRPSRQSLIFKKRLTMYYS